MTTFPGVFQVRPKNASIEKKGKSSQRRMEPLPRWKPLSNRIPNEINASKEHSVAARPSQLEPSKRTLASPT